MEGVSSASDGVPRHDRAQASRYTQHSVLESETQAKSLMRECPNLKMAIISFSLFIIAKSSDAKFYVLVRVQSYVKRTILSPEKINFGNIDNART